jgi:hypothetical protein
MTLDWNEYHMQIGATLVYTTRTLDAYAPKSAAQKWLALSELFFGGDRRRRQFLR